MSGADAASPSCRLLLLVALLQSHQHFSVGRLQRKRAVVLQLVSLNFVDSLEHLLLGLHVVAHHPCAACCAERYRALLCVSVKLAEDAVAACASVHALLFNVESYEGFVVVVCLCYALTVNFGYFPFSV